jgi:hypothetical protein
MGIWQAAVEVRRGDTIRFVNRRSRTVMTSNGVLVAALFGTVSSATHGAAGKTALLVLAFGGLALAVRASLSHVLIVGPARLQVKSLLRTRSWGYSELESVDQVVEGQGAYNRSFAVLHPRNGANYRFTSVSEAPNSSAIIQSLVANVNQHIANNRTA